MSDLSAQPTTMTALLDLSRLVCASLDLHEVLGRVIAAVRDLSGAEVVSIMLLDERGDRLTVVAAHGIDPQLSAGMSLRLGEGIAGWVALNSQPLQVVNPSQDPRYKRITPVHQTVIFSLPLRVYDRTLGAINLARTSDSALFEPGVAQVVEIFASHAAIAIANAASAAALRYAAARERLTNLVSQASAAPGAASRQIERILAELGAALEANVCALMAPGTEGYSAVATWSAGEPADIIWEPDARTQEHGEQIGAGGCDIYVIVQDRGKMPAWLIARALRPDRYWRMAERDLLRFAADQISLVMASERLISAEQRARDLSLTLSQLANACNAMIDQDRVLDFILEQLARFVRYDSAGVFLFHDQQYARLVAGYGYTFDVNQTIVLAAGPGSPTWLNHYDRRATYIPDVRQINDWQNVPDSDLIRSWIGVPLIVNESVIGVLTIDKWTPSAFADADVQVAQMFGDHLAVAINNARLLREAQTRASQIHVIHQLSGSLSAISDVQSLLDEVAGLLHRTFGYYQVVIGLIEGDRLVIWSAQGIVNDVAEFGENHSYPVQRGVSGWVARHGETLMVNDVSRDSRYAEVPTLGDTRSELSVAIRHGEAILGVIDIESNISGSFNQSDVYLAESLAGQVAVALANIRRYEELRRTQERLLHSERMRAIGELSSGIAHDFNNLLSSILGHAQLLIDATAEPETAEGLRIIERAAHDGAASVRRLQNFAQTNRSLPDEEVLLNDIVDESLSITRPRWRDDMQSRGAQLKIVRDLGDLPPIIGDGAALRDLVTNLILNAIDAMPEGGELRLRTELLAEGEPSALIAISDTGVGMSGEVRQRIFDPFFSTKGSSGTGMGLSMAYGIAQQHQGAISVESEPGRGTTFQVRLPVRRLAPASVDSPPDGAAASCQPIRILVVEDDDGVRRVLAQILRRAGHDVIDLESAQRALALLRSEDFDLLCTDLGMPEMSGWELIAEARAAHPSLATVLITGWGEQIDAEEARARGADAVLAKPFDTVRLRQLITAIQQRGSGSQLGMMTTVGE
ncbi:GAF domain-containing protein [Oscillochloris sp. ZM17-4]|uniref:GAF domain-containing protein n=1 Tax=Oscillochloris sp. ZM17-4 TaxID=2866714 RepID=UPI001C7309E6|nr:GAF domain-containing protein [Oscillochloris sp. ZM17-4]MBX0330366.1 GAF domain-containing protein [Oscillochloris sp. ZM17-4]